MRFYSTGKISETIANIYSLNEDSDFCNDVSNAIRIKIISAFYSRDFITNLCDLAGDAESITFIVSREKGKDKQKKQIQLLSEIQNDYDNISIRLVDSPYLLHTKLYIFAFEENEYATWIGSSNASMNSLDRCEELMTRFDRNYRSLDEYYTDIMNKSHDLNMFPNTDKTKHYVDFFNQGKLYIKTSETFTPSIELNFGDHKDTFLNILVNPNNSISSLFTKATTKLSLLSFLKKRVPDYNEAFNTPENNRSDKTENIVKKYGIFTCLGLWVPDGYDHKVKQILYDSPTASRRKKKWEIIHNQLSLDSGDDFTNIKKEFKKVLSIIANIVGVPENTFYTETNINKLTSKLKSCLIRINPCTRTENRLLNLLLNPYYTSVMPDIWNDELAKIDFLESFCESLDTENEKDSRNNVYHSILRFSEKNKLEYNGDPIAFLWKYFNNYGRWFCQYDLKEFLDINRNNADFRFRPWNRSPEEVRHNGAEVFVPDTENAGYLNRGTINIERNNRLTCTYENINFGTDNFRENDRSLLTSW